VVEQYCPAVGCVEIAKRNVEALIFLFSEGFLELGVL